MTQTVEESDLDFKHFRCCGDEDLYPFGCPRCGRINGSVLLGSLFLLLALISWRKRSVGTKVN